MITFSQYQADSRTRRNNSTSPERGVKEETAKESQRMGD